MGEQGAATGRVVRHGALVPEHPQVSVCVLLLDDVELGRRCLDALRRPGGLPAATEVVVVANGTRADQLDRLGSFDDLVVVVSPVNLGFGGGCNVAAAEARGEYLVLLNDDSRVEAGCIEALVEAASSEPGVGAVCACILSEDGSVQEAGSVLWRDGSAAHVGAGGPPDSPSARSARDVDIASANGLLVRHDAWNLVGGFDERYFPAYFEDVDLCLALAVAGLRVRFEPRARLVHLGSRSTSAAFRGFLLDRNRRLLVDKWRGALDQFEPRPAVDEGQTFDAAVARAVERSARRRTIAAPAGGPSGPVRSGDDPAARAALLEAEYREYLEVTVVEALRRRAELERYVAHRLDVRLKRWVWAQRDRWRR